MKSKYRYILKCTTYTNLLTYFFILEAIFDGLENSAGDIKPLESLFQFTEESSGKIK